MKYYETRKQAEQETKGNEKVLQGYEGYIILSNDEYERRIKNAIQYFWDCCYRKEDVEDLKRIENLDDEMVEIIVKGLAEMEER